MDKNIKLINICVLAVIICFFTWFLSSDIFSGDDTMSLISWLYEGGKYNLDGIITSFMPKFFGQYFPLLLHMNPHEFSMTIGAAIRGIDTAVLCLVISLFMFIGRPKTKAMPWIIGLSAFYFCYASSNMDFEWLNSNQLPSYDLTGSFLLLTEYSQHFGQLVTFILGLFAIYYIISHFAQNELPNEKHLILTSSIAFLTAVSSLFVNITTGFLLLFVCLYLIIANFSFDNIFKKGKTIYIPVLCYIAGTVVFAFFPGFCNYFADNTKFIPFLKGIFKMTIQANSFEIGLIIILSTALYFLALHKTTYIKRVIYSVFITIAAGCLYFGFFTELNETIILQLTESQILFRLLLMALIFLLFGSCMKELTTEPKTKKVISFLFTLTLTLFFLIQIPYTYTTMRLWHVMAEETKVTTYCLEKMYRFYSLRHKTALLPEDALLKIFKISPFISDKKVNSEEKINNMIFFKNTPFTEAYYKTFYKNPYIVSYKFINAKRALKIFYEEGGMIDNNEIKHLNFQKLYDDKFVLNRAIEKAKYDIKQ